MDTDFFCLALAEEDLDICILPSKRAEWKEKRSKDCRKDFRADGKNIFSRTCCSKHKKHDKREPVSFKEEFRCSNLFYLCSKTFCCCDSKKQKYTFSSKGLSKRALEDSVFWPDGNISASRWCSEIEFN